MLIRKIAIALSALLFAVNVQAVEAVTSSNAKQLPVQTRPEDPNLTVFNQNVGIALLQRGIENQNNQAVAVLVYEVTNRGKGVIKELNWISAFTLNNQVFFLQEIKTNLNGTLNPGQTGRINVLLPLDRLPENIRPIFANTETAIGHLTVAKQIDFANGQTVVVKQ